MGSIMLLFFSVAVSQTKIPPPPAPVMRHKDTAPLPPPPKIIGYPATRNGKNVWVMKPRPIKATIPTLPQLPKKDQ